MGKLGEGEGVPVSVGHRNKVTRVPYTPSSNEAPLLKGSTGFLISTNSGQPCSVFVNSVQPREPMGTFHIHSPHNPCLLSLLLRQSNSGGQCAGFSMASFHGFPVPAL